MLIVVYKAWVDSRQLYACWRYILITIWMRTQETRLQFRNRHHTRFTVDVRQFALRECQWPVCILTCFFFFDGFKDFWWISDCYCVASSSLILFQLDELPWYRKPGLYEPFLTFYFSVYLGGPMKVLVRVCPVMVTIHRSAKKIAWSRLCL